uniref:Uncharacterized protein n=1 Tax=Acrobeloides nanus TaxID=290746 RepID=A0A914CLS0_9BILA
MDFMPVGNTEPLYAVYASPNLTNFLGSIRWEDQLKHIPSVNDTLTIFIPESNHFANQDMMSSQQLWLRNPKLATQNCTNSDNFLFIVPTQKTFHLNQSATDAGRCETSVAPSLPSGELTSATFPTLCIANIDFNGDGSFEVLSKTVYNNSKLFECTQETCKFWNDTCVNGQFIKFILPSNGRLELDLYSIDDPTTKTFNFNDRRFGVLMSRNYPLLSAHQDTTQKVICNTGLAKFNLTFLEAISIPENTYLRIKEDNWTYSFTNMKSINPSIHFNSSQAIIEYLHVGQISLKSTGFIIHYEGTALNIPSIPDPIKSTHTMTIVLCSVGGVIVLLISIMGAFCYYRYKKREENSLSDQEEASVGETANANSTLSYENLFERGESLELEMNNEMTEM